MARKIKSGYIHHAYKTLNESEIFWVYNALDAAVTHEIHGILEPQLDPATTRRTYDFERNLQGPIMDIMMRGFRVDKEAVEKALHGDPTFSYLPEEVGKKYETLEEAETEQRNMRRGLYPRLHEIGGMKKYPEKKTNKWVIENQDSLIQVLADAIWGQPLNYHSPKQIQAFLYGALRLPEQTKLEKGKLKVCTDEEALEHLAQNYPRAKVVCKTILLLRGLEKLVEVLEKGVDDDARMRCSYHIAGTETGRLSSSTSVNDTGTNMQNITNELRRIFVPDPGYILCNVDLEQAESRGVAYLSREDKYIRACEGRDLHTTVASMLFNIEDDRAVADRLYYRHFSYRHMAKSAGHGLNYGLSPNSLAVNMHITQKQAWRVYLLYLGGELRADKAVALDLYDMEHEKDGRYWVFPGAFPGIKRWHLETVQELEMNSVLVTPFGRKRTFWGRLNDGTTAREAIAFRPQSLIADVLNTGMLRIRESLPEVQLLAQVHDSLAFQVREKELDEIAPKVLKCLRVEIEIHGRTLVIPAELKFGHNWRDMRKWSQK